MSTRLYGAAQPPYRWRIIEYDGGSYNDLTMCYGLIILAELVYRDRSNPKWSFGPRTAYNCPQLRQVCEVIMQLNPTVDAAAQALISYVSTRDKPE